MTEDEKPVTDLETLFAVRIKEERIKFFRDLLLMAYILVGFLFGMSVFAGVQYWVCYSKNPEVTILQCLSHSEPKTKARGSK